MRVSAGMVMALCSLGGCFDPQIRDGQIACELDLNCPEGFVCLDGLCRNTAPAGKGDDTGDDDGGGEDDGGPPPLGPGPKLYTLEAGAWSARSAAEVFAGSAINPGAIQTGFSQCDAAGETRCYGDDAVVACDFGSGWVDGTWDSLAPGLGELVPTFGASVAVGSDGWDYYLHRGREWRGYAGPRLATDNTTLVALLVAFADSQDGDPDLDEIYDGDPNAPSSFDQIVYDYLDTTAAGDPWHFVEAGGRRFTIFVDGSSATDTEPHLALPGAPSAGDVRAALMCNGALELYAVD